MVQFTSDQLRYNADGLIPAIVVDTNSGQVLMLAYMNQESLARTLATRQTWFYSRSRQRLWHKGEQSGHVQVVEDVLTDCDQDTLLIKVRQVGPGACHEGYYSCFHYGVVHEHVPGNAGEETPVSDVKHPEVQPTFDAAAVYGGSEQVLHELYRVILDRKANPAAESYTAYLFREGVNKILKKVGEECTEVVIAAKDPDKAPLVYETADLLYHLLVLLAEKEVTPDEVLAELRSRQGNPPHR